MTPDEKAVWLTDPAKTWIAIGVPPAWIIRHDGIVHIPTGDSVADAIYNMERAGRDYSLPQKYVAGSADGAVEKKCCAGCPDCQGIPGPRPCVAAAETCGQCVLDIGHGGLHK